MTERVSFFTLLGGCFWVTTACSGSAPAGYGPFGSDDAGAGEDSGLADDAGAPTGFSNSSSGSVSGSSSGVVSGSSSGSPSASSSGVVSGSSSGVVSGSSSGVGSGSSSGTSSSGGVPTTGVCANAGTRLLTNSQPDAFIDDFEESSISTAWSSFNDVSPVQNSFLITQTAGGAANTAHAGHYAGMGAITTASGGFGVGTVYNTAIDPAAKVYCIDIAPFTGVSFWAKAATTGSMVSLNFVLPQTNMASTNDAGVSTGGDCETNCYNHPRITFSLTTSWTQYVAPFSAAGGGSATVGSVIQELAWLSPDSSWDFSLDEIAFYAGTPASGAVGPHP